MAPPPLVPVPALPGVPAAAAPPPGVPALLGVWSAPHPDQASSPQASVAKRGSLVVMAQSLIAICVQRRHRFRDAIAPWRSLAAVAASSNEQRESSPVAILSALVALVACDPNVVIGAV